MKCTFCDAGGDQNRYEAMAEGWRLLEVYGPRGNKYLVACPSTKHEELAAKVMELITEASPEKRKRA